MEVLWDAASILGRPTRDQVVDLHDESDAAHSGEEMSVSVCVCDCVSVSISVRR